LVDTICIFEDQYFSRLLPLVYFRAVYELKCGILSLREKIQLSYPQSNISLHMRSYLAESFREKHKNIRVNSIPDNSGSCLFINGRILADSDLNKKIKINSSDNIYYSSGTIVAAKLSGSNLSKLTDSLHEPLSFDEFEGIEKIEVDVEVINYPWDLVGRNGEQISADFKKLVNRSEENIKGKIYEGVHLINPQNIFIGEGTKIKPGVVLDAEEGPIYIGKNVKIFPNAVIEGPCYIGNGSSIKIGAKIYEGTSIGEVCKVGGEVEESIIHSYSNKQHDGFLGHAYLGSWVNLGADTNNSDLKNNYGKIKVIINDESVDSGSMFVGLTMGDHSKSAINTMFNTGTVVGVSSNVFGSGFPPKYIPSFAWGGSESMTTYQLGKCVKVAGVVMGRRKIQLTKADEKVFKTVYELTKSERHKREMP
jgi:UDP-N-acetylglucosamine diphosphorylase/glucosamine-1-phosphate N-acetyltransferase